MPRVTIGDRSHLLTIVAPAGTLAVGETDIEGRVPAAITPWHIMAQRQEYLAVGAVQQQATYTVNIAYRTDVPASYLLREECCTQRQFQIVAIIPTDRRDGLDITCVTSG